MKLYERSFIETSRLFIHQSIPSYLTSTAYLNIGRCARAVGWFHERVTDEFVIPLISGWWGATGVTAMRTLFPFLSLSIQNPSIFRSLLSLQVRIWTIIDILEEWRTNGPIPSHSLNLPWLPYLDCPWLQYPLSSFRDLPLSFSQFLSVECSSLSRVTYCVVSPRLIGHPQTE